MVARPDDTGFSVTKAVILGAFQLIWLSACFQGGAWLIDLAPWTLYLMPALAIVAVCLGVWIALKLSDIFEGSP